MTSNGSKWTVSSRCSGGGCVAVAVGPETVRMRDDKHPDGPVLAFDREVWAGFVADVKAGRLDGPA